MAGGKDAMGGVVEERLADQLHIAGPVEMIDEDDMAEEADVLKPCHEFRKHLHGAHGIRVKSPLYRRLFLGCVSSVNNPNRPDLEFHLSDPLLGCLLIRLPAFNHEGLPQH
jgi:hypothetical protein